jgi:hypothetical protein
VATTIQLEDVWATQLLDHPGDLGRVLTALANAGASLDCVIGRRQEEKPGTGVVFVSPIKGRKQIDAAELAGMQPAHNIGTVRVESSDKPGLGAKMCAAIADAGLNLKGVSAAVIGNKSVVYFGFDSKDDAKKAAKALKGLDRGTSKARSR